MPKWCVSCIGEKGLQVPWAAESRGAVRYIIHEARQKACGHMKVMGSRQPKQRPKTLHYHFVFGCTLIYRGNCYHVVRMEDNSFIDPIL